MRGKMISVCLILLFTFFNCSKSDNGNGSQDESSFTLEGTVYIDYVPADHVLVEFGGKDSIYLPNYTTSSREFQRSV